MEPDNNTEPVKMIAGTKTPLVSRAADTITRSLVAQVGSIVASCGANAVLAGILLLLGRIQLDGMVRAGNAIRPVLEDSPFWAIAWIAIAIIGIIYQLRAHRDYTYTVETYRQRIRQKRDLRNGAELAHRASQWVLEES